MVEEEGVQGMKGDKSEKQRTAFVTGAKKRKKGIKSGDCESDLWKHSGWVRGVC